MGINLKYLPTRASLAPLLLGVVFLAGSSCNRNRYDTDISGIEFDLEIHRFEKDLFTVDLDSIAESVPFFYDKYGEFFDLFNYRVINIGGARQVTYPDYLKSFLTDYLNHQVYQSVLEVFPDMDRQEEKLNDAFKRYSVHFPGMEIPELYTFVSRFNQSIVTAGGILGIGLDKYLGAGSDYYPRLGIHQYQSMNMYPDKIPVDCMTGWGMTEFAYDDSIDNVLTNMIYNGKIACFTKWMLPDEPDSVIMGFTADQMKFCRNNEARMWEFLVEHKVLFETDRLSIQKYTGAGPFTSDFTRESPARAAVWIGWRIAEEYLRKNPDVRLADLMREGDYQRILTLSGYNP